MSDTLFSEEVEEILHQALSLIPYEEYQRFNYDVLGLKNHEISSRLSANICPTLDCKGRILQYMKTHLRGSDCLLTLVYEAYNKFVADYPGEKFKYTVPGLESFRNDANACLRILHAIPDGSSRTFLINYLKVPQKILDFYQASNKKLGPQDELSILRLCLRKRPPNSHGGEENSRQKLLENAQRLVEKAKSFNEEISQKVESTSNLSFYGLTAENLTILTDNSMGHFHM